MAFSYEVWFQGFFSGFFLGFVLINDSKERIMSASVFNVKNPASLPTINSMAIVKKGKPSQ